MEYFQVLQETGEIVGKRNFTIGELGGGFDGENIFILSVEAKDGGLRGAER